MPTGTPETELTVREQAARYAERVDLYERKLMLGFRVANGWKLYRWIGSDEANAVVRLAVWEAAVMCEPGREKTFSALVRRHVVFRIRRAIYLKVRQDRTLWAKFADVGGKDFDREDGRGEFQPETPVNPDADPDAAEAVRKWVSRLTPLEREAIALQFGLWDGRERSYTEIAAEVRVSRATVAGRVQAGMQRLRRLAGVA